MADSILPASDILRQVLEEYSSRISIDSGSKLLVSDIDIAAQIAESTKDIRTPYGPTITVATRGSGTQDASKIPSGVQVSLEPLESLTPKMDHFTHAVFAVNSEDPKVVLEGLRWMRHALRPKGIAIVISLKQGSGEGKDGQFMLDLEDKIKYQSRGKVSTLTDVLEIAKFERGKIRAMEMRSSGPEGVEAQVVLAMKWDQLTA
ncbi:hypothetical protein LTR08_006648 [Meristemomyces frigidus]|nr:hypothetical protein LTR08_006648 [Meristemomyces frigidus]